MNARAKTLPAPASGRVRRIYLLRHAEADYFKTAASVQGSEAVPLSAAGRQQASVVGAALKHVNFDKVVVSGLLRTLETARLVLGQRELPLEVMEEFKEIRRGNLAELPDQAIDRAFAEAFRGSVLENRQFLGGETFGSLLDRVHAGLERLFGDPDWNSLLLVLHGAVNRAILSHALTGSRSFFGHFEQAPACLNILDYNDQLAGRWIVRATNLKLYDPLHAAGRSTSMEDLGRHYRQLRP